MEATTDYPRVVLCQCVPGAKWNSVGELRCLLLGSVHRRGGRKMEPEHLRTARKGTPDPRSQLEEDKTYLLILSAHIKKFPQFYLFL